MGLRFPKEYGGRGATWVAELSAIEEVGVLGFTLACLYSLSSIIGEPIYYFGLKELKEKYLKPMLKGEIYGVKGDYGA